MIIKTLPLDGLKIIENYVHNDERGTFERLFCASELNNVIGDRKIVQINKSMTAETGTIRGIHFQHLPHSEMKLIRCIKGRVWDVAIDLRKNSPTFMSWHGFELSSDNRKMVAIPEGFGHGFQSLESGSELIYLHTSYFAPNHEGGLRFNDPRLGITWPLKATKISKRDSEHPLIDDQFEGLNL